MQALVTGAQGSRAILVRPMETPDPTPGRRVSAGARPAESSKPDGRNADEPASRIRRQSTAPDAAPAVVAVLVTSDPGPWLEDALASLAAQEYPALSVLVLDNGSAEDPTPRIAATMPRAFVRRLASECRIRGGGERRDDRGRGRDVPAVLPRRRRARPRRASASWSRRRTAPTRASSGPKLVDYDHPDILLEVGMAVDHYGVPFSGIEPGEVDQEQHDAVRDVFYVSDAAMLVRADLFHELGGFDPATFPGSDDLDLCWRAGSPARGSSSRPDARVRHRRATVQDERPTRRNDVGDLQGVDDAAASGC